MAKLTPEATTEILVGAFKWIFERYHEKREIRLAIGVPRRFPSPYNKKGTFASFAVINGMPTIQLSNQTRRVEEVILDLFHAFYHALDYLNNPATYAQLSPNHQLEVRHREQAGEDWKAYEAQRK